VALPTFGLVATIFSCIQGMTGSRALCGRSFYHGRLLVYLDHFLCQSSGHHDQCISGIAPVDSLAFILAQLVAASVVVWAFGWLLDGKASSPG